MSSTRAGWKRRERIFSILNLEPDQVESLHKIDEEYGKLRQIRKLGEEGAELAAAVLKHLNVNDNLSWNSIIEEMVDNFLMICQVIGLYYTEDDEETFQRVKNFKLNRELERIAENDN